MAKPGTGAGLVNGLRRVEKAPSDPGGRPVRERPPVGRHPLGSQGDSLSFSALKQRQLVFLLTRQLVEAQFVKADPSRTSRLWQEVAALNLDPERIIALLYGVADHADDQEMERVDRGYRQSVSHPQQGWWAPTLSRFRRKGDGWHQNAPLRPVPTHP